jgi:transposase
LLKYKAEMKGINVEFVDARYTSQICSHCQQQDKGSRDKGIYRCKVCGLKIHADINAATNIRNRFLLTKKNQLFPSFVLGTGGCQPAKRRAGNGNYKLIALCYEQLTRK